MSLIPFFVNNVSTTLSAAATSTATTLSLSSTTNLPSSIPTGSFLPLTLNDVATGLVYEIVYVTAISGSNVTVERAQEGTGAQAWNTGDYIRCSPTAGTVAAINGSASQAFNGANATTSTEFVPLGQAQANFAAINGSSSNSFFINSGSNTNEADIGALCGGVNSAYLYNSAPSWGLYSADGGSLISYTRAGAVVQVGGGLPVQVAAAQSSSDAVNLGQFGASLAANGYSKLPNGLILQWGLSESPSSGTIATFFPVVFPNALLSLTVSITGSSTFNTNSVIVQDSGTNAFYGYTGNTGGGAGGIAFYWMAIGY